MELVGGSGLEREMRASGGEQEVKLLRVRRWKRLS